MNLSIYGRALPYLVRNPSILAMPLLAAVLDMLLSYTGQVSTDPLGGLGSGIFGMIIQIVYLFAFGVAIIQANNIARGYKTKFDDAWVEARRKAGGIFIAAIGFQFIVWVAAYAGSLLSVIPFLQIALQLLAYFFLILTIPAAAIGGLPGGLALSGSIRAVRANPLPCLVLAIVFAVLWIGVPLSIEVYVGDRFGFLAYELITALARALVLAYMAFPFAVTYDDIAFKLW
ncbi:MAG: hypothetical protein JO322_02250 [Candidatus Eremiobacteraeota bacterium]|nr:hypothetical protein [Candidatus Eremiobacteraeota bacterium]